MAFLTACCIGFAQARMKLQATPGENDEFGWSVDIDGDVAIVGAFALDNPLGLDTRKAYIFRGDEGGNWNLEVELLPDDLQGGVEHDLGSFFGHYLAIKGATAVIGATHHNFNGKKNSGAVYVFDRNSDGPWELVQQLFPSESNRSQ